MKNKYVRRSKISEAKFRKIIRYFNLELDSQKIAALTSLNRNTVNRYLGRIRTRIVELCEAQAQSCHPDMAKGVNRQDGAPTLQVVPAGDEGLPVFGIRSRNDHIYTALFPNGVRRKLRRLTHSDTSSQSLSVPKEWCYYDGIVDLNGRWHYRLSPFSPDVNATEAIQDLIEAFLGFARKRLLALHLNGNDHFNLYLKECEFRFNNRNEDLYQLLLKRFRDKPLS